MFMYFVFHLTQKNIQFPKHHSLFWVWDDGHSEETC